MVNRSGLRQVPWQSWEHWQWVADGIFSGCSDRIVAAQHRIKAWQARGHVPISVETTSALTSIQQRDPHFNRGLFSEDVLPDDMLRMMYAMALQRLVNGVVDVSAKRNSSSVASRAESAGLPRLLVDIRHETAHNELPGLPLLRAASEQALEWLKDRYWETQKQALGNVRQELKTRLLEHCQIVVSILTPMMKPKDESSDGEDDAGERKNRLRMVMRTMKNTHKGNLKVMKQKRVKVFKDLENLCLISSSELVSILVDDGLLERGPLSERQEKVQSESDDSDTDSFDLEAATYTAWRYTICRLSSKVPRLPDMLLVAIVKRIGSSRPIGGTASSLTSVPADYPKENESSAVLNRLTAWCAWLLESEALEAPFVSVSQDAMKSKILGISRKLSVKADLSDELCRELLRSCLRLSVEKGPLDELVSLIALKAGNKKLQQKALMLAKFGSISSRPGSSQKSDGNMNQESVLGSAARLIKKTAQGPAAGALEASVSPEKSTRTSEAAYEDDSSYEKVKTLQQDLLARMASKGMDSNKSAPLDAPRAASEGAASVRGYRDAGPQGRKWTLSQKWRPCAIGMIPSPYSVVGILPSLDLPQTAAAKHMSERQARVEGLGMQPHTSVDTVEDRNKDRVTGGEETSFSERNAGKRKGEVESSSLSGEKRVKVGNRVRFNLENGGNGKPSDPLSSRQSSVRKEIQGARSEVPSGGSLLQGCLRQHGQFMFVSSEQLESLKAAVHVL